MCAPSAALSRARGDAGSSRRWEAPTSAVRSRRERRGPGCWAEAAERWAATQAVARGAPRRPSAGRVARGSGRAGRERGHRGSGRACIVGLQRSCQGKRSRYHWALSPIVAEWPKTCGRGLTGVHLSGRSPAPSVPHLLTARSRSHPGPASRARIAPCVAPSSRPRSSSPPAGAPPRVPRSRHRPSPRELSWRRPPTGSPRRQETGRRRVVAGPLRHSSGGRPVPR